MANLVLNEFTVKIMASDELSDAKLDCLVQQIDDALDDIQFGQIIRQKFDDHLISGVKIVVEDRA